MTSKASNQGGLFQSVALIVGLAALALIASLPVWALILVLAAPFVLRYAINTARRSPAKSRAPELANDTLLGQDEHGRAVVLSERQLAAHGLVLGATGSGKSTSLLKILCDAVVRGAPVVAIDLKGSLSFGDQLHAATRVAGRPFNPWRLEGPAHWNPLKYGDASELKDKLISAERFTEPHYQRAAERYLQTAIQVLQVARPDRPVTLAAVVALLDPNNLKALLPRVPRELMHRVGPYLSALNRDQRSAITGLQSRLAVLSESTTGAYLQPGDPSNELDLRRALCGGNEVVLFSLNSSRHPKLAAQIAAMVIQDLINIAGHRLEAPNPPLALIAIDEFSALDADNLLGLLARARDAGISVLLATQELADLNRVADGFRDQVLGNTAITIAHRQNVPDSAELIARMIGTETAWQHTYQTKRSVVGQILGHHAARARTGLGTARQVEEFRIHPNTIKELPTGHAVLITKLPPARAEVVRVAPWTRDRQVDAR